MYKEITVNGQKYLLAHTVPEVEKITEYPAWTEEDYIMGEPDYIAVDCGAGFGNALGCLCLDTFAEFYAGE